MTTPFDRIVTEHGPTVLRVCRALLDPEDAEDAWSDTFMAALRAYPDLRPGSNIEGWLVTIAHRRSIDVLRRRARRPESPARIGTTLEPATPAGEVEGAALADGVPGDDLTGGELAEAVRALPPKQQAAVVHHYLGGLPYREVGELLGTTPEAARRSAADGIAALRTRFDQRRGDL